MKYSVYKQDHYTVFQLEEELLNSVVAPDLKSEIVILANEGVNNLIFDLSEVKYIDSAGLSAILTVDRLMKIDGSFVLTGIEQPAVKKLFEISRLDSVLAMAPSVQEAIEFVFKKAQQRKLEDKGDEAD